MGIFRVPNKPSLKTKACVTARSGRPVRSGAPLLLALCAVGSVAHPLWGSVSYLKLGFGLEGILRFYPALNVVNSSSDLVY